MDSKIEYGSSDKTEWLRNHTLTEEQKQSWLNKKSS